MLDDARDPEEAAPSAWCSRPSVRGSARPPALTLRSYLRAGALVLELSDDGRGIAWDGVRDKARAAGLPAETQDDLGSAVPRRHLDALGVSEMSGRGIGLGVLAEVCRTMGCTIGIDSRPGAGTTLRFEFLAELARGRREKSPSRELIAVVEVTTVS